jgi:O-antigen/teichoic acid export membrane protein
MKSRQILLNAATTFGQVIGSAAALFILYRFLIRTIGLERLGIWSLVLATTSVVTLANQGFSTSIVKFVAKYAARDGTEEVSALMQTAVLSTGLGLAVVSAALYPGARWILGVVLPHARFAEACAILPLALLSLWISVLTGTVQAGLAGRQAISVCNYVELGGSFSYLALAVLFVPKHGLMGLACAQVIQGVAFLLAAWLLLRSRIRELPLIPHRWSRALFREIAGYGFQFQLITASQALREPVTKALITKFGGLAMTGFYDLAARWVFTFRELLAQSSQVLVPTVSHLQERDPGSIPAVYRESYRLIFFLAVPTFASLTIVSPLVSRIWIGRYEPIFVEFVAILAAGWLVNVLSNPAYVVDLGTGALRWVLTGCAATAVLNASLGFLAGRYGGGIAVVASSAISLALGYVVVLVAYHIENQVAFGQLLPRESRAILIASLAGALALIPLFGGNLWVSMPTFRVTGESVAALVGIIFIPAWLHPMRKRLFRWVASRVAA